jgi:hypothetical protein
MLENISIKEFLPFLDRIISKCSEACNPVDPVFVCAETPILGWQMSYFVIKIKTQFPWPNRKLGRIHNSLWQPLMAPHDPPFSHRRLCRKSVHGSTGSPRTDHGTLKVN